MVKRLRSQVGDRLAEQRRLDGASGVPPMSAEDERQFARALIVAGPGGSRPRGDHRGPGPAQRPGGGRARRRHPRRAVRRRQAAAPAGGRPQIENIDINGCDRVFLGYADGREVIGEPVAESDEELVELIQVLAAYSGLSSRPFDTANPQLDLRLPDGSRLSAVMDVTLRPAISIRRARLGKVFLADLVGNGTLLPELGGVPRRGRCRAEEHHDRRGDQRGEDHAAARDWPTRSRRASGSSPWSARSSWASTSSPSCTRTWSRSRSGCRTSEGQGAISMAELVRRSLRMNPSRVIVGEVLGDEIVTMLNAMTQGNDGSLSTIHANSSLEVFNRIATYAIQAARTAAGGGHAHADRRGHRLRRLHREAQRVRPGRAGCAGSSAACGRSPASTAGCCPVRCSRPARTAAPCRTRRRPACRKWPSMATTRSGGPGEPGPAPAPACSPSWPEH